MMEAVHRYEGTVNQVMGDGIMALFGAPLAHEDHAVRACYAALRMQESVTRYAEGVRREQGVTIRIRVGLNSGEVVVRAIGSDLRMDYSAIGQTTHLAARMEQLADPGATLLTSETLALAEGFVQVTSLGPMAVKGLAAPVETVQQPGSLIAASLGACSVLLRRGTFQQAVQRLEGLAPSRGASLAAWSPLLAGMLGYAYAMTGRVVDALPILEQAVDRAHHANRTIEVVLKTYLVETYLLAGRHADAGSEAESALELSRLSAQRGLEARVLYLLGELASQGEAADVATAHNRYDKALALADALGQRPLVAHCQLGLGKLYRRIGRREQAQEHLTVATTMYREMDMRFWLEQAEAEMREPARRGSSAL
jgi:tetratricopeptide (TPR) repeat protein